MRDHYTKGKIAIAWVKKKLGIVSPSALCVSNGEFKYDYDYIMRKEKAKHEGVQVRPLREDLNTGRK